MQFRGYIPDPCPKSEVKACQEFVWPVGLEAVDLSEPLEFNLPSLSEILDRRYSRRDFAPLSIQNTGFLLWYVARTISLEWSSIGCEVEHRSCPSSGGLHPVRILVHTPDNYCYLYYSRHHKLKRCVFESSFSKQLRDDACVVVPASDATLIQLVAEIGKTNSKYENPSSLIFRDAGVLIGYMSLVAEALGYNFCPLGITGDRHISKYDQNRLLVGVGLAWLGAR